jgi:hypothetical protein
MSLTKITVSSLTSYLILEFSDHEYHDESAHYPLRRVSQLILLYIQKYKKKFKIDFIGDEIKLTSYFKSKFLENFIDLYYWMIKYQIPSWGMNKAYNLIEEAINKRINDKKLIKTLGNAKKEILHYAVEHELGE